MMVFPFRDSLRTRTRPLMTYLLITANFLIFLLLLSMGKAAHQFIRLFAVIPLAVSDPAFWSERAGWPLISSIFLHGSWSHLLGNMLYLWVFGDNIEELLGRFRFLLFFLLCGIFGNIAHILANPDSPIPTIGASGSVAGVLGAYLWQYPRASLLTLVPLGLFVPAVRVPAWAYLGLWFLLQLGSGLAPIWVGNMTQMVAFWAHVGGFLSGIAFVRLLLPKKKAELAGR